MSWSCQDQEPTDAAGTGAQSAASFSSAPTSSRSRTAISAFPKAAVARMASWTSCFPTKSPRGSFPRPMWPNSRRTRPRWWTAMCWTPMSSSRWLMSRQSRTKLWYQKGIKGEKQSIDMTWRREMGSSRMNITLLPRIYFDTVHVGYNRTVRAIWPNPGDAFGASYGIYVRLPCCFASSRPGAGL